VVESRTVATPRRPLGVQENNLEPSVRSTSHRPIHGRSRTASTGHMMMSSSFVDPVDPVGPRSNRSTVASVVRSMRRDHRGRWYPHPQ